jgi:hypothetical protein
MNTVEKNAHRNGNKKKMRSLALAAGLGFIAGFGVGFGVGVVAGIGLQGNYCCVGESCNCYKRACLKKGETYQGKC